MTWRGWSCLVLACAACQGPALPGPGHVRLEEAFEARTSDGTARLLGHATWPVPEGAGDLVTGIPAAETPLELLDAGSGELLATTVTDRSGDFRLENVPRGSTSLLRVARPAGMHGGRARLEQAIFPTTSLHCARVDLASTLLVERLRREDPSTGPEGRGSSVLERLHPDVLARMEAELRERLRRPVPPTFAPAMAGLDDLLGEDEARRRCEELVRPPEATLVFRLAGGVPLHRPEPPPPRPISGLVTVTVVGMPADVLTAEVATAPPSPRHLATLTPETRWSGVADLWDLPPGSTVLDIQGVSQRGRRSLARIPVKVDHSVSRLCE